MINGLVEARALSTPPLDKIVETSKQIMLEFLSDCPLLIVNTPKAMICMIWFFSSNNVVDSYTVGYLRDNAVRTLRRVRKDEVIIPREVALRTACRGVVLVGTLSE